MIITDESKLITECKDVSIMEISGIVKKLETELKNSKQPGIGLAANQIGINRKVCIIRTDKYSLDLANPKIIEQYDLCEFYNEGCLSYPDIWLKTKRYNEILLIDDLHPAGIILTDVMAVIAQHECLSRNSKIVTENGIKNIKEIVESKYSGNVLCFNFVNNKTTWAKVIGWSKRKNKNKKKWVRLKSSKTGPNKQLICTEDHMCAYIDNIICPQIKFTEAKNLLGKYIIRREIHREKNSENALYNAEQIAIIAGGLLGDFHIDKMGTVIANHGKPQIEYAKFKSTIMGGKIKRSYSGFKDRFVDASVHLPITEQTKWLRRVCYTPNKCIQNIIPLINEISLAFWFMDDGCCRYKYRIKNKLKTNKKYLCGISMHTESFSYKELKKLKKLLRDRFGYYAKISTRKINNNIKYMLILNKDSSDRFIKNINKYIPQCMEYKIPKEYRGLDKYKFDINKLDFSCKLVNEISYLKKHESCLYDITVDSVHNFFADDTLVHNCDHLYGRTMFQYEITAPRVNEKCWCGSGKKYKKCHMKKIIKIRK